VHPLQEFSILRQKHLQVTAVVFYVMWFLNVFCNQGHHRLCKVGLWDVKAASMLLASQHTNAAYFTKIGRSKPVLRIAPTLTAYKEAT